ncbi:hypothetical protein LTR51_002440 [Lithohypha guttulata]|nr:hypothetical protein LTR51_002440 [Lithohypha guttulata]
MFQFTALSGAQSTSRASQSLLELDGGVKILVDVGWDSRFDTRQLADLEKHVSTLSFILLTHATISHLGAYAHCCKHIPFFSQVPVYATVPVVDLGRTTLQDLYSSTPAAATFIPATASPEDQTATDDTTRSNILIDAPTAQEIHEYFAAITPLKYSQPTQPKPSYFSAPLEGLILTAYNAGHTLGGTIWHIQQGMESIVYAVDWHQARENVIAGASWFAGGGGAEVSEVFRNPTALICSSVNGDKVAMSDSRKARDEALIRHIRSGLSHRGSVLIPVDSSARVLELSYFLEKVWQESTGDEVLKNAKIYMATKSGHATLKHAKSLLEWMDDSVERFEADDEGNSKEATAKSHKRSRSKQANGTSKTSRPFDFRHIKIIETQKRLDKILSTDVPKVIIASDLSLDWGHSRTALESIAPKPDNLVILTENSSPGSTKHSSTASMLWRWHMERLNGVAIEKSADGHQFEQVHTGRELIMRQPSRKPLDENELIRYQQYIATRQQMKNSLISADGRQLAEVEEAMEGEDESSDESEDDEYQQQGRVLNISAALTQGNKNKVAISDEDLGVSILLRKKDVFDFDVRHKKGRNAVFPYTHSRRRGDEFGDFIKPEEFLREEEREAQEAMLDEKNNFTLGQKRKWAEEKKQPTRAGKKQKQENTSVADGDSSDDSESDHEEEAANLQTENQQGPAKVVYEETRIDFQAKLAFVDFAGLHDQRSLQMLIPLINPKKLILIGGSASETAALAKDCKDLLGMKVVGPEGQSGAEIYSPQIGDVIDASVDTNAWTVKLTRDLVKRLQWQNVKQLSIVTVTGQLRNDIKQNVVADENNAKKMKLTHVTNPANQKEGTEDVSIETQPVLDALSANIAASIRAVNQPIHVGDLKIRQLLNLFNQSGHSAVLMMGGTLIVDGTVAVRKLPNGQVVVEGPPVRATGGAGADSFSAVKRMIYDGLAVVAG